MALIRLSVDNTSELTGLTFEVLDAGSRDLIATVSASQYTANGWEANDAGLTGNAYIVRVKDGANNLGMFVWKDSLPVPEEGASYKGV